MLRASCFINITAPFTVRIRGSFNLTFICQHIPKQIMMDKKKLKAAFILHSYMFCRDSKGFFDTSQADLRFRGKTPANIREIVFSVLEKKLQP